MFTTASNEAQPVQLDDHQVNRSHMVGFNCIISIVNVVHEFHRLYEHWLWKPSQLEVSQTSLSGVH